MRFTMIFYTISDSKPYNFADKNNFLAAGNTVDECARFRKILAPKLVTQFV